MDVLRGSLIGFHKTDLSWHRDDNYLMHRRPSAGVWILSTLFDIFTEGRIVQCTLVAGESLENIH